MSIIRTIKELKDVIKDLPDDMLVDGYSQENDWVTYQDFEQYIKYLNK